MKFKEALVQLKLTIENIKLDLQKQIQALPDNPNIERVKGQAGSFVISSSELFSDKEMNMSPRYYDFKFQYEFLCHIIDYVDVLEIEHKLKEIVVLKTTKYWYDGNDRFGTSTSTFKFNPTVINLLDKVIKDNF